MAVENQYDEPKLVFLGGPKYQGQALQKMCILTNLTPDHFPIVPEVLFRLKRKDRVL